MPPERHPRRGAAFLAPVGVPRIVWPKDEPPHVPERAMAMAIASGPTSFGPRLAQVNAMDHTFAAAGTFRDLGDRPVAVLSAMQPKGPDMLARLDVSREQAGRVQQTWLAMHDEEAAWSNRSTHRQYTDSTHYSRFD